MAQCRRTLCRSQAKLRAADRLPGFDEWRTRAAARKAVRPRTRTTRSLGAKGVAEARPSRASGSAPSAWACSTARSHRRAAQVFARRALNGPPLVAHLACQCESVRSREWWFSSLPPRAKAWHTGLRRTGTRTESMPKMATEAIDKALDDVRDAAHAALTLPTWSAELVNALHLLVARAGKAAATVLLALPRNELAKVKPKTSRVRRTRRRSRKVRKPR